MHQRLRKSRTGGVSELETHVFLRDGQQLEREGVRSLILTFGIEL